MSSVLFPNIHPDIFSAFGYYFDGVTKQSSLKVHSLAHTAVYGLDQQICLLSCQLTCALSGYVAFASNTNEVK